MSNENRKDAFKDVTVTITTPEGDPLPRYDKLKEEFQPVRIQTNAIRGRFLQNVMDRAIREIHSTIEPMLGPGASDAIITKEDQPYYTRDGMEVMESMTFDNELARYAHHFLFQAAWNQGRTVGDGTTTLIALYTSLYMISRNDHVDSFVDNTSINRIRAVWKKAMKDLIDAIKEHSVPLTKEYLLSMLYTCTQDSELAAKIYLNLGDALMNGAFIVPRKSNIATDFQVTTYSRPLLKVTRQYTIRPMPDHCDHAVIFYCNGMLDIAHYETLLAMAMACQYTRADDLNSRVDLYLILLCNGLTECTRNTLREFNAFIRSSVRDVNLLNNIAIYTLNDYRSMSSEELEDIATIITEEPGIGGMTNALTFETLLYRVFNESSSVDYLKVPALETYDMDPHLVDQTTNMFMSSYPITIDPEHGMRIDKELGPVAKARYDELIRAIEEEKSPVKKVSLNKRLRKTFGMFIDLEVGSALLKDSQRKFELILDAILSASDAARDGVLLGNSLMYLIAASMQQHTDSTKSESSKDIYGMMIDAAAEVFLDLISNYCHAYSEKYLLRTCNELIDRISDVVVDNNWEVFKWFDLTREDGVVINDSDDSMELWGSGDSMELWDCIWPQEDPGVDPIVVTIDDKKVEIVPTIVEPVGIITNILKNSILPIELSNVKVVNISGKYGFMGNYIP